MVSNVVLRSLPSCKLRRFLVHSKYTLVDFQMAYWRTSRWIPVGSLDGILKASEMDTNMSTSSRRGAQAAGRRHAESLPPLLSDSSSEKIIL